MPMFDRLEYKGLKEMYMMVEIRTPISVDEAINRLMKYKFEGTSETVSFHVCDGRRLAEPIVATSHVPSFDKSPYDGFAFRSEDTAAAKEGKAITFEVVEHIGAGTVPEKHIQPFQATRIMTGAQIPEGADCVEMFEKCEEFTNDGRSFITVEHQMKSGQNIIATGSEVKEGSVLIEKGTFIDPGVKALLATFGYAEVKVAKKPVVGVLATGTELLDIDEPLEPGKIRNSNAYMICSQIERAGGDYQYYGALPDELDSSYDKMKSILEEVDVLITTGGVSVGDFDLIPEIYEKLEAEVLFNKVAQRPGSVTTVAHAKGKLLFGLSGNPSACFVGFELYTRPILQHALMNPNIFAVRAKALLAEDFPKTNPFSRFVRSYITLENGQLHVHLAGMDKSNVVSSLARTTSLMELPASETGVKQGDEVEVLLLHVNERQNTFR